MRRNKPSQPRSIEMTTGSLWRNILLFSLPLMLTQVLEVLFNLSDVAIAGKFAGYVALGAVGSTTLLVSLFTGLLIGMGAGVNVAIARSLGLGDDEQLERTLHTSFLICACAGLLVCLVCAGLAGPMLRMLHTKDELIDSAVSYLRIYALGLPAMAIYNFGNGVLSASGDTKRPLIYLSVAGAVNVALNLFFVIVCKLDVAGVAIATVISQCISASLVLRCMVKDTGPLHLDLKKMRLHPQAMRQILRIGLPAGFQGILFSLSNVVIQSSVNTFGEVIMAGNSAAANIEQFVYVSMNAMYQATISFTSQNYGAGKKKRMDRVLVDCMILSVIVAVTLGGGANLFGPQLLHIYTTEADVIACGTEILLYTTLTYFLCGIMDLIPGALRGMGHSAVPMILSIIGTVGTRIFWIYWVFPMHRSLMVLFLSYPASWTVTILLQAVCFYFVRKKVHSTMPQEET